MGGVSAALSPHDFILQLMKPPDTPGRFSLSFCRFPTSRGDPVFQPCGREERDDATAVSIQLHSRARAGFVRA